MPETTALGAAMAAGKACGVWSLNPNDLTSVTFERFHPNVSQKGGCRKMYIAYDVIFVEHHF